jgi:folate-binding protein YgfZ
MTAAGPLTPDWLPSYEALTRTAATVNLGARTQIVLTGEDRARFLHNLTTNEIRKLVPGTGCEAFLTTVQGKTLAHGFVFAGEQALVLDAVAGTAETILKHLDHYLVSERVVIEDHTSAWAELYVGGPQSESLLAQFTGGAVPQGRLAHAPATLGGAVVWMRRVDLTGPVGFLVSTESANLPAVAAALAAAGAAPCSSAAFDAARIERGVPLFGLDISDKNLPQEINRDALAISFVKGCYLGQETVARIDALGHVNRLLVGVRFVGPKLPPPGCPLSAAGAAVGEVTSATYSPRLAAPLALAFVRRGHNTPGTPLESPVGSAEVIALPVS